MSLDAVGIIGRHWTAIGRHWTPKHRVIGRLDGHWTKFHVIGRLFSEILFLYFAISQHVTIA